MKSYINAVKHFITSEDGPTAVEYAVVCALIIIGCIVAVTAFGDALRGWFEGTTATIAGIPTS